MATFTNNISGDTNMEAGLEPPIEPIAAGLAILFLSILTIAGNILLLSTIKKLRKTNRKSLHTLHVTLGIYSGLELVFAAIPQLMIAASFLIKSWRLDSTGGWCNFTAWFAFTTKTTCAFITAISILERYVETCNQNSRTSRFQKIINSQLYWTVRSLFLAGLMATVPLFYGNGVGISSSETSGSYCHMNFELDSSVAFIYTIILCICGYGLLQLVLFCAISLLCQFNNMPNYEEGASSNPAQLIINRQYYTTPPASPVSRDGAFSPSKYALDSPTFFETMENDARIQHYHLTRVILIVTFWYWICLLPYLIMMTITLANYTISDVADFTVTIIILINSALTPYLLLVFYPLYKRHIPSLWCCLSHQDKRLEPRPSSPDGSSDHLPRSVSVAYNEMSPVSLYVRSTASPVIPWQTNGSMYVNQTRANHTELNHQDLRESDNTVLVPNGGMVKQKTKTLHSEPSNVDQTDASFYDNKGFLPDDQRHNKDNGEMVGHSDGTSTFTEDGAGSSTESECSACDLIDEYPHVVVLDKQNQYYYPTRIPMYSNSPMDGVIYQQDPQNPHILYAVNTSPRRIEETTQLPSAPAGRILGRAELRKMTKKGRAPPTFYTRDDIPCETSLYSHNYRTPSFLKQYNGRAGWKEIIEIERRAHRNAPASDGDHGSLRGLDEFDIERRNTWSGARLKSRQTEMRSGHAGVDRQVSYRLAVGDDDYIDKIKYIDEAPIESSGPVDEDQPEPLLEQEVVLRDVQVGDPLSMNMVFQKVIATKDSNSLSSSQRSSTCSSKCSTETVRRDNKIPIQMQLETERRESSANILPTQTEKNVMHGATDIEQEDTDTIVNVGNSTLQESNSNEKFHPQSMRKGRVGSVDEDNISISSLVSDVSYRQYVRAIESKDIPDIMITSPPAGRKHSLATSESGSIHSVESLLHMFSVGVGKLHIPSFQQAKDIEYTQRDRGTTGVTKEKHVTVNNEEADSVVLDVDFDDASFVSGADFGFASDFLAEFDRKLKRKAILSSTESDDVDTAELKDQHLDDQEQTSGDQTIADHISAIVEGIVHDQHRGDQTATDHISATVEEIVQDPLPRDQTIAHHISLIVEEIVEDHLNNVLDTLPTEIQQNRSSEANSVNKIVDRHTSEEINTNIDLTTIAPLNDQANLPYKLQYIYTSDTFIPNVGSLENLENVTPCSDNVNNNACHKKLYNPLSQDVSYHSDERTVEDEILNGTNQEPHLDSVEISDKCLDGIHADDSQSTVHPLETSNGWLNEHVTIELKQTSGSDEESTDNTLNFADEQDHCQEVPVAKNDGLSQSITIEVESESDGDDTNTSGYTDIPYLVRYNVPFHVLETDDTNDTIIAKGSAGVLDNFNSNTFKPEEHLDEVPHRSYRDNGIQEVLKSPNASEESTSHEPVQTTISNDASVKTHDTAPNWVKELFKTPAAPPNSPAVQDIAEGKDNPAETPEALSNNRTDVDGQERSNNIKPLDVTTCHAKQKNGIQTYPSHKSKKPPPTLPKPKRWKKHKRPIVNSLKENKPNGVMNALPKERLEETSDIFSTPQKQHIDELVVPGVAPRKRSPRSLWKKYRKDMLALPIDNGNQRTNDHNMEANNLESLPNVGRGQEHHISNESDFVEPYPDKILEPNIEVNFHNDFNKVNDSKSDANEGYIWDTIEQKALSDTDHPKNQLQDQLFQKLLENPSELKESIDHKSCFQIPDMNEDIANNDDYSHQIPDGTCKHPDILGVKIPENTNGGNTNLPSRSGNSFSKEDLVVLNANGITCLNVPNKDFPSPDGSPTNISVVDMVVIEVQGKTSEDHQDSMLDLESENPDDKNSNESSFSSDDLSSISIIISAYSPEDSSRVSVASLENSTDQYQKTPRTMSVCSAESEDLPVCSGELSGCGTQMPDLVGRKRTWSLSTNIDLQRNDSLLSNSEIL